MKVTSRDAEWTKEVKITPTRKPEILRETFLFECDGKQVAAIEFRVSGTRGSHAAELMKFFAHRSHEFYMDLGRALNSDTAGGGKNAVHMEADESQKTEKKMATQEKAGG